MTPKTIITAAALTLTAGAGLAACEQVGMNCTTARGSYTVTLHLKSGTGECAENPGGVFGMNAYNYPGDDGYPDYTRASMAIQSEVLGTAVAEVEERLGETPDPDHKEYAAGDFSSGDPNGKDVCFVPTLTVASKELPALPAVEDDPETPDDDESLEAKPAESFKYEWSNLRFVVKESLPGTLFVGDLTYTHDGCTATYEAWGLYGVHPITGYPLDCADDNGAPDDSVCTKDNPEAAYLNFDLNIGCDPGLLLCTIKDRPPVD